MTDPLTAEIKTMEAKRAKLRKRMDKLRDEQRELDKRMTATKRQRVIECECGNSVKLADSTLVRERYNGYRECGSDNTEYKARSVWICQQCGYKHIVPPEMEPPAAIGDWYSDDNYMRDDRVRKLVQKHIDRKRSEYNQRILEVELSMARRLLRKHGELP